MRKTLKYLQRLLTFKKECPLSVGRAEKSASVLLYFFMNWASNVLRCCLIHIIIIILRRILYSVNLCSYLEPGLFMLYLCDLVFIFSFIFIMIDHITSLKQVRFFEHFWEYLLVFLYDKLGWRKWIIFK